MRNRKDYQAKYYQANKERMKEQFRSHYQANRETKKAYYQENREGILILRKKRIFAHLVFNS